MLSDKIKGKSALKAHTFLHERDKKKFMYVNICLVSTENSADPLSPLWIRPWHASERRYLSEMFRDHRTQSRTRL